ncbi:MAG: hypothetical protein ACO4AI_07975 [Prochlorothrix sp.]|nr:hypothetical protein [Prochlorothrix sp.]
MFPSLDKPRADRSGRPPVAIDISGEATHNPPMGSGDTPQHRPHPLVD